MPVEYPREQRTFLVDHFDKRGYSETIDYTTGLNEHWDVTGDIFTPNERSLTATGSGRLVYNGSFEHNNFAVALLVRSLSTAIFEIETRYTALSHGEAQFDFATDTVILGEEGGSTVSDSFNFVDNQFYVLSLWVYENTQYVWINDYNILTQVGISSTASTFALNFVSGSMALYGMRVRELVAPIAPSRESETSNTLVQYRKTLQDDLSAVAEQNWEAYKDLHNKYRYGRNIGGRNLIWESQGYPVQKPSTDAFFND